MTMMVTAWLASKPQRHPVSLSLGLSLSPYPLLPYPSRPSFRSQLARSLPSHGLGRSVCKVTTKQTLLFTQTRTTPRPGRLKLSAVLWHRLYLGAPGPEAPGAEAWVWEDLGMLKTSETH